MGLGMFYWLKSTVGMETTVMRAPTEMLERHVNQMQNLCLILKGKG